MKTVIPILSLPFLFTSCDSDSSCANCTAVTAEEVEVQIESPKTSADELLEALGGEVFTVEFPEDLPERFYIGLAIKHSDGRVVANTGRTSSSGLTKAGSARVFFFNSPSEKGYRYQILAKSVSENGNSKVSATSGLGSIIDPGEFKVTMTAPQGRIVKPGDGLLRFNNQSGEISSGVLAGDNFDIIFQITPYGE